MAISDLLCDTITAKLARIEDDNYDNDVKACSAYVRYLVERSKLTPVEAEAECARYDQALRDAFSALVASQDQAAHEKLAARVKVLLGCCEGSDGSRELNALAAVLNSLNQQPR